MEPPAVVVRVGRAGDLDRVSAIDPLASAFCHRSEDLSRALAEGRLLVADSQRDIVGYAVRGRFFAYDFLELLFVAPPYRRRGMATVLVGAVKSGARTEKLFTSTNQSNTPMQRLCDRLGFEPSGVVYNLDEADAELFYVLRLKAG